eukprot:TRINITY_DN4739_c0_g1_i1.p1 TRINITY_DN4739_c0_g1~~TRINITY_DN4739_c0_g1_i1.p1  ORF type:complete len:428 (+),score=165.64 TRINITY_DN4739_c0_g1_i1:58-1341(+)
MATKDQVLAVIGAQWGDEGKGKLVDILSFQYDLCCRYNGGSNAGHTIKAEGKKFAFHLVPSGILNRKAICVIGNGCVVHLPTLLKELEALKAGNVEYSGRLKISNRAHLVFDFHQAIDGINEDELGNQKIGTTKKGIGPTYAEKMNRTGVRVGDLLYPDYPAKIQAAFKNHKKRFPSLQFDIDAEIKKYENLAEFLKTHDMIDDTLVTVNEAIAQNKRLLLEGANAIMLDIDFGTYPFVTSSSPGLGGAVTGLGIPPSKINSAVGIVKAYTTRVGEGPFPTELLDEVGQKLREIGGEFGTTTGRPRRCGWLDLVVVKYTHLLNNYNYLNLTKLDVLTGFKKLKIGVAYKHNGKVLPSMPADLPVLAAVTVDYIELDGWDEDISKAKKFEDLPANCQKYVKTIEQLLNVPVKWIGVGPQREEMIELAV